ncbi:hypothetical protein bcgnr5385_10880 [Bacillus cereus]
MPPLYNKEFSVNFEPSSFDKFFSSVEYIEHNLEYINKKLNILTYQQIATQHKKERAGEPALSKPSYGIIFGNRLIVAQLVKLDV